MKPFRLPSPRVILGAAIGSALYHLALAPALFSSLGIERSPWTPVDYLAGFALGLALAAIALPAHRREPVRKPQSRS